eukprot:CAMPEP_0177653368 /NCGR_PEP_ID=MMETSP0447-20121125/13699_1 /TAXON_ID=0 /ORGANISM="Stygamoeba regulata, Strain BSH-02190019" /LENGTH=229 /DNA_ID=CAMNT_0019156821 /DNA_START=13 /DNA_END=702 /DNA_ORIENTATION=+
MTYYHFLNCVLLTYAPLAIAYKCTSANADGAARTFVLPALFYLLTQFVKMIVLATFVPSPVVGEITIESFEISTELMKAFINSIEYVGIHFALNGLSGRRLSPIAVGIGWSTVQAVVENLLPLWLGARSIEFQWDFVYMALSANASLCTNVALASLLWLLSRRRLQKNLRNAVYIALFAHSLLSVFEKLMTVSSSEWGATYATLVNLFGGVGLFVCSRMLVKNHYEKKE